MSMEHGAVADAGSDSEGEQKEDSVEGRTAGIDEEEKRAIEAMIRRIEVCIGSDSFHGRILERLSELEEEDGNSSRRIRSVDQTSTLLDGDFVVVDKEEVLDSLAEHLVISYIRKYHRSELESRNPEKNASLIRKVSGFLGVTLKELVLRKTIDSIMRYGATGVALGALAFSYPKAASYVVAVLWKIIRAGFLWIR